MFRSNPSSESRLATVLVSVVLSMALSAIITMLILQRTALRSVSEANSPAVVSGSEENLVRNVVAKVRPAVVSVIASKKPTTADAKSIEVGGGSGFVVNADGLIVTNRHVIDNSSLEFKVVLQDGKEYPATILGTDPVLDIGLLKIDAKNLPTVEMGDSSTLYVGQTVLAIGNSLAELQNSVTKGIVSGLGRQIFAGDGFGPDEAIDSAIQIDAAINPGNSGGPLIDLSGKVVGVNTAMSRGGQLIGFSLPINSVRKIIDGAIKNGRIIHPWVGVRYQMIDADLAKELKFPVETGAVIMRGVGPDGAAVIKNSPGEKAGLKENDIITKVNNSVIDSTHSLRSEIAKFSVGDTIIVEILRQNKKMVLPITLEEYKNK